MTCPVQGRIPEVVYLVFPDKLKEKYLKLNETALLRNDEFAEWIQKREAAHKGQFVYFNTSCWSKTKAIHEIEYAASSTLLNIPTTETTYTFVNDPKNAEHLLFSAFRAGKNFQKMREALEKNEDYRKGKANRFIFPDEQTYQSQITNIILNPIRNKVSVKASDESSYSIEAHENEE